MDYIEMKIDGGDIIRVSWEAVDGGLSFIDFVGKLKSATVGSGYSEGLWNKYIGEV